MSDFWIFGYGSLIWHPGFLYEETQRARLFGYHRSLCIYSHYYRGTPEHPGLVMGLIPKGSCRGVAFHVSKREAYKTYQYLLEREQVNGVYKEKQICLHLEDGRKIRGLTFVADRMHAQYGGILPACEIVRIVSSARGKTGSNLEYVLNTVCHLRLLNICDPALERIASQLSGYSFHQKTYDTVQSTLSGKVKIASSDKA